MLTALPVQWGAQFHSIKFIRSQPSECEWQHTLISVHAQTAAWQQANGNFEARMFEKCGELRDCVGN